LTLVARPGLLLRTFTSNNMEEVLVFSLR